MSIVRSRLDVLVIAVLAVLLRVSFWAHTGRLWEDGLTNVTNARNAVAGLGLTHHVGEPASHSFTSVLSVLIPLAGEAVGRDGGLVAIRVASLIAAAVTVFVADELARRMDIVSWGRLLIVGYLAVDANHIFYGMTGMETQVAVAALLVSAWAFTIGHRASGIALGVALLARPDFLIWAAIVVAFQATRDWRRAPGLLGGALVVVGPWIAFATMAYGSPVPQSIVAKAAAFTSFPLDMSVAGWIAWLPDQLASRVSPIGRTFAPFLEDTLAFDTPVPFVLPVLVTVVMFSLAGLGIWAHRRDVAWSPLILFVLADLVYRIIFLPHEYHDWYVPPFTATAIFLVAAGAQWLATGPRLRKVGGEPGADSDRALRGQRGGAIAAVVLVACFAFPLPWVFGMERAIQVDINEAVRIPLGQEIGRLVRPGEPVVLEAPGIVGWVTQGLWLMDYPGLTSRTAYTAVQHMPRGRRSLEALVDALRPTWVVMRPVELDYFEAGYPATAAEYRQVWRIGTSADAIGWFGYSKVTVDSEFIVLRRGP